MVRTVAIQEVDNVPCKVSIYGALLGSTSYTDDAADGCAGKDTAVMFSLGPPQGILPSDQPNPPPFPVEVVTGVKACTNSGNGRVKGITVRTRKLQADGRLLDLQDTTTQVANNCSRNEWRSWAECPTGSVMTGLMAHYIPGVFPRPEIQQIVGLELRCSMIETR